MFDDPLALTILDPETAEQLRANAAAVESSPLSPFLRAAFAVRSRFAEDELATAVKQGVRQYVVLGAGLDTFAYRNPYSGLRVFEVDYPATQEVKRQRLATAGLPVPSSATYVPIDFSSTSIRSALANTSFDSHAPSFFSWLGVVPYLEREAIETTLRFVSSQPASTSVVFDYGSPPELLSSVGQLVFRRMSARVAAAGEPWKTFFAPAELLATLRRAGFSQVEDFGPPELNGRYFAGRTDGLRIGEMVRIAKAVV